MAELELHPSSLSPVGAPNDYNWLDSHVKWLFQEDLFAELQEGEARGRLRHLGVRCQGPAGTGGLTATRCGQQGAAEGCGARAGPLPGLPQAGFRERGPWRSKAKAQVKHTKPTPGRAGLGARGSRSWKFGRAFEDSQRGGRRSEPGQPPLRSPGGHPTWCRQVLPHFIPKHNTDIMTSFFICKLISGLSKSMKFGCVLA